MFCSPWCMGGDQLLVWQWCQCFCLMDGSDMSCKHIHAIDRLILTDITLLILHLQFLSCIPSLLSNFNSFSIHWDSLLGQVIDLFSDADLRSLRKPMGLWFIRFGYLVIMSLIITVFYTHPQMHMLAQPTRARIYWLVGKWVNDIWLI